MLIHFVSLKYIHKAVDLIAFRELLSEVLSYSDFVER